MVDFSTLTALAAQLGAQLKASGATFATAESCTGGLIGAVTTANSGSSAYYVGGLVTYANSAKTALCSVSEKDLASVGAVSEEVACQMALGARQALGSTWAVSVTGVAGPDGGSAEKPVGTVWIGLAGPGGVSARLYHFEGNREAVRFGTVAAALRRLLEQLEGGLYG